MQLVTGRGRECKANTIFLRILSIQYIHHLVDPAPMKGNKHRFGSFYALESDGLPTSLIWTMTGLHDVFRAVRSTDVADEYHIVTVCRIKQ